MFDRVIAGYLRGPSHSAKLRVVRLLARTLIPARGLVAAVSPGLRLYLHPSDWIEHLLLTGAGYEPHTLAFIESNLSPGDGAVLAGVNFGLHVAVAARAVGASGRVVGVEPQPAALLRTRANLALNGLEDRVSLVAAALGSRNDLVSMAWSRPDNPGAASLVDSGPGFMTPMVGLESVLPFLGERPRRLLLLDVQGYEEQVLMGMDLSKAAEIMLIELDAGFLPKAGGSPQRIAQLLVDSGFELFDVLGAPVRGNWYELPEKNLVAVRAGVALAWNRPRTP